MVLPWISLTLVNFLLSQDESTKADKAHFAFIYGGLPTAPSVFLYVHKFKHPDETIYHGTSEIIAFGIVLGTILSAPFITLSAWVSQLDADKSDTDCKKHSSGPHVDKNDTNGDENRTQKRLVKANSSASSSVNIPIKGLKHHDRLVNDVNFDGDKFSGIPYKLYVAEGKHDSVTEAEAALIEKLKHIYSNENNLNQKVNKIARILGTRTPPEIVSFVVEEMNEQELQVCHVIDDKKASKYPKKSTAKSVNHLSNDTYLARTRKDRITYEPCNHDGPCVAPICKCAENGYCEKYCGCSVNCPIRAKGCTCAATNKSSRCNTKSCACYIAQRECDPDLCLKCGASEHPVLAKEVELNLKRGGYDHLLEKFKQRPMCCNVGMQRGEKKLLYVGYSNVHGWGLFAGENIKVGDFIVEYVGEKISRMEADRRGLLYDNKDLTYLFNLNKELDLDSTRRGNKAKYANCNFDDPNMIIKVMTVAGDHRVGLYAKRNILAGEELDFDYGYGKEESSHVPVWFEKSKSKVAKEGESSSSRSNNAARGAGTSTDSSSNLKGNSTHCNDNNRKKRSR